MMQYRRADWPGRRPLQSALKMLGALGLLSLMALRLPAQSTGTVMPGDPAYHDLQLLLEAGVVPVAAMGHHPLSRRAFRSIARHADSVLAAGTGEPSAPDALLRSALARLLARFAPDAASRPPGTSGRVAARLFSELRVHTLYTDSPSRPVLGNGLGDIEADLNPLTDDRGGRRFALGTNAAVESEHWLALGSRVVLQARPRVSLHRRDRSGALEGTFLTASARALFGNVAVTAGREYTDWSIAPGGGLFLSRNAPALDMIRVASDAPFVLPSVLRYLGPASATLLAADLGASERNSHSRLVAYKVSVSPAPTMSIGATFANHFGGAGAKNPGALRRVVDLVPFIDIFQRHEDSTEFDSDKLLGVDGRVRVPRLANMTLYGELALEDFDVNRLGSVFTEDAAYAVGVLAPTVAGSPLSVNLSYHVTGIRFYLHHAVTKGFAASRFTLGDNLGRDASGWYGTLSWQRPSGVEFVARGAWENRGGDSYIGRYTEPNNKGLRFFVVSEGPTERRLRGIGELRLRPREGRYAFAIAGGAERVALVGPRTGVPRLHGVLEASASLFR